MVKVELATVNLAAILGLTLIVIVALVMKEANVASMAVGGIAGFIGHRIANKPSDTEDTCLQGPIYVPVQEPIPEPIQEPMPEPIQEFVQSTTPDPNIEVTNEDTA